MCGYREEANFGTTARRNEARRYCITGGISKEEEGLYAFSLFESLSVRLFVFVLCLVLELATLSPRAAY